MHKVMLSTLIGLLVLAGCASQASTTPATLTIEPPPTQAAQQPTPAPATMPTEAPDPAGEPREFNIVPGESSVSYEVGETLFNQNNRFNLAIGTTNQLSGKITVDPANPQDASIGPIEVDISQFQSDNDRRDNTIRDRFLESRRFPIATFVPNQIEGLPASYTEGETLNLKVSGDLTVHEVTKPVTFDVQVTMENDELRGSASTTLLMSDFGIGPIEIGGILGTEDQVKLSMEFVAR